MGNNNTPKLGCGTILIIILVILFLIGGSGNNSSSRSTTYRQTTTKTSNPIRDKDPEFYDYLENRYNNMIKNQGNP